MTEGDYIEELLHNAEKYGFRDKLIEIIQHTNLNCLKTNKLKLYEHYFSILENDYQLKK